MLNTITTSSNKADQRYKSTSPKYQLAHTLFSINHVRCYREAYFVTFLLVAITCWSPSNALGYLAPWLAIATFFALTLNHELIWYLSIVIIIWLGMILFHWTITNKFMLHGAILSLFTYGTFIFFFCIQTKLTPSAYPLRHLEKFARWILLGESILGIIQAVYGITRTGTFDRFNGDYVEGTIHPWLQPELAFSNPIFAVNIVMLLLFLLPSLIIHKRGVATYFLGMLALTLASVMHVLLFFMIAIGLSVFLYQPFLVFRKSVRWPSIFVLIGIGLIFLLLRNNLSTVNGFIQATLNQQTPRTEVLRRVSTELPEEYPLMPLIGLGPGQFSSRASLIGTGMFFGTPFNPRPLPFLPQGMSEPFQKHILDLWLYVEYYNTGNNTSSTFKPFFSWLSLYTEFGFLGIVLVFLWVGKILLSIKFRYQNAEQMFTAIAVGSGVIFVFFLGLQENYWEVSQAIFPGLLLLNAQRGYLLSTHRTQKTQLASS